MLQVRSIFKNDRVIFLAGNSARAELAEAYRRGGYRAAEDFMAIDAGLNGANGGLSFIEPERIPEAMTDMPMLAAWSVDDDDGASIWGKVYGFPDYCITDPWAKLRDTGRVEFVVVVDYGEAGARMPPVGSSDWASINAESFDRCLEGWMPQHPPALAPALA